MSTEYSKSEVIEKVKKLLALSKSTNQHEAELAAQRASELMKKYQIDSAVVEAASIKTGRERVADVHFDVPDLRMKYQWVVILGMAAAKLFDGTILVNKRLHGTGFAFIGFESEIPMMREMFLHLYNSWKGFVDVDLAKAKAKHVQFWGDAKPWEPRDTMKFKHGHGQGYSEALYYRCVKLAEERKVQVQAASNDCRALVLVRDGAITAWMDQQTKLGNVGKSRKLKQTRGSTTGFESGFRAGQTVAIGGALNGGTTAASGLLR